MIRKILYALSIGLLLPFSVHGAVLKCLIPSPPPRATVQYYLYSSPAQGVLTGLAMYTTYVSFQKGYNLIKTITDSYDSNLNESTLGYIVNNYAEDIKKWAIGFAFTALPSAWLALGAFQKISLTHPVTKMITMITLLPSLAQLGVGVRQLYKLKNMSDQEYSDEKKANKLFNKGWSCTLYGGAQAAAAAGMLYIGSKS